MKYPARMFIAAGRHPGTSAERVPLSRSRVQPAASFVASLSHVQGPAGAQSCTISAGTKMAFVQRSGLERNPADPQRGRRVSRLLRYLVYHGVNDSGQGIHSVKLFVSFGTGIFTGMLRCTRPIHRRNTWLS